MVEILPTGLPELFQPSRTSKSVEKLHVFRELTHISGPKHILTDISFNFLHPVQLKKTRWHARVRGVLEGYLGDSWRKFGGRLEEI